MHIIIDGYNMIRQSDALRRYERLSLEAGRNALIRSVSHYKKQRGHKVTVVFDGWQGGPVEEERAKLSGIDIIYSRKGEKADEVIKRMVQERAEEIVVVTSDRGIADFVGRRGRTAIFLRCGVLPMNRGNDGAVRERKLPFPGGLDRYVVAQNGA